MNNLVTSKYFAVWGWAMSAIVVATASLSAQTSSTAKLPRFKDAASYFDWVRSIHKAPFPAPDLTGRAVPQSVSASAGLAKVGDTEAEAEDLLGPVGRNNKVRDARELFGLAVDPTSERNAVVLGANNFFVTSDEGRNWTQDFIPFASLFGILDPYASGEAAISPAGISFDRTGHTVIAGTASGFVNSPDSYYYSEMDVIQGFNHGQYLSNVPATAAIPNCGAFHGYCDESIVAQGVVTDTSGTATDGTTYAYYTVYCNSFAIGCDFGFFPPGSSVLFSTVLPAAGGPFSSLGTVSDPYIFTNVGGAGAMVDSAGKPHFIYSDYSNAPEIGLHLDDLETTVATVADAGLHNPNWNFPRGYDTFTPRCGGHGTIAYCAFDATQIGESPAQTTLNIYLAAVDVQTGIATISRVNNDPLGNGKQHFNPSVAVTQNGDVYVGWFDGRRDAGNQKVDYFVGKSTDGGKTFPVQKPVNEVAFNPVVKTEQSTQTIALSGKLAAGPTGVVHAAWTDTRSGIGSQVYSQDVKW